jgi:DNA polymerase III delta prime subunit
MEQILRKPIIFACIPALNEGLTLGSIIVQAMKYVDEVFVCDDGSIDSTAELSIAVGANVIRHQKNMGKGAALKSLFKTIEPLNPDIVVLLDGDGQHNPDEIPKIIEPIQSRCAPFRFTFLPREEHDNYIRHIASCENVQLLPEGAEAIFEVCGGDLRRATNTLQAAASMNKPVDAKLIYSITGRASPSDVQKC